MKDKDEKSELKKQIKLIEKINKDLVKFIKRTIKSKQKTNFIIQIKVNLLKVCFENKKEII